MSEKEILETILVTEVLILAKQIAQEKSSKTSGIDEAINKIAANKDSIISKLQSKMVK